MTKTQPTVISVKGDDFIQKEAIGNEALSPGHLLEQLSTGNVQKLSSVTVLVDDFKTVLIALENSVIGEGVTDAYASGDTVKYAAAKSGQEFLLRLPASAAAIVIGDALENSTDGTVILNGGTNAAIAIAKEAVNNSGGGTEVFILAEVI